VIKILSLLLSILIIGSIPQVNAADLTVSQLKNGKYYIPGWEDESQGEWVQLKDGEYHRKDPKDILSVEIVSIALGYLSHKRSRDAAVVYGYNTGGTGFFVMLCAVVNDKGQLNNSKLVYLEDRVKINSLSIRSGKIVVDMLVHRSTDPAPLPTLRKIATYTLVGYKLVEK
jgi:hypothetical protein